MVGDQLAIIIPAFNEESTIKSVIKSVSLIGKVIIIDDGSIDNTLINAAEAGAFVHSHSINLGYDKALNTGFEIAEKLGYQFIITMDADGQHDPNSLIKMKQILLDGYDLVVASRDQKQRFSEYLFSLYSGMRWSIKDPLSGLKGYKISLYTALGHFDSYNSIGTELLVYALKNKYDVCQIETKVRPRQDVSRFGKSLITNLKILRALFFGILF